MAVNKVEANGETLIDLTNDTVRASDVLKGKTLHLASGVQVEGTYNHDSKQDTFVDLWEAEVGSAGVNELDIDELSDFIDNYSALIVTLSNELNNSEIINSGTVSTAYCPLTDGFMRGVDAAFVLIVVPYISDPIHYDHVLAYVFLSQRMPMPEPNPKSIMVTGTRDESSGLDKLTGLYLRKIVGIPISGWKLAVLSGYMPLSFPSNGDDLLNYRIYGTANGAGVQTEQHGYKIPLTVKNSTETKTIDVYIGDSKLGEEEYVDYGEQKIYKRILFMTHDDKHFITKDNKDFCLRRRGYSG